LTSNGQFYSQSGDLLKALSYFTQALSIYQALGTVDLDDEARTMNYIGGVYSSLGQPQKALDYFEQALPISREGANQIGEALALNGMGLASNALGKPQEALDFLNKALPMMRELGSPFGEATVLNNLGLVYSGMGEYRKALDLFNQSLPLVRKGNNPNEEASTLNNIGLAYIGLGDNQKAVVYFSQALPILREAGEPRLVATTLNNIGGVYSDLGDPQKALDYYNQAAPIFRAAGYEYGLGADLNNIGNAYRDLGEPQEALDFYNQALPIAITTGDPLAQSNVLGNLMFNRKATEPALAIFYGKQAVNLLQQVRRNIQGLDKEIQSSFLASKGDYYHDLADLLISQGRLPEAEQVLDLLKQQEYSEYVRDKETQPGDPLSLTPAEQQAEADYQRSTAQLVTLGQQWADLKKLTARTPDQERKFKQISDQLDAASKGLSDYYARLYVIFGKTTESNKQIADVKGDVSALEDQIADTPHTAALYTMVTPDHYRVIVITSSGTVARETAIAAADINKKIADFQQVLRTPARDPKPLAQELYKILIAPIQSDLDQAHATTLVWSLDGVLRYIPIAALYDGSHYVVERYNTVTITPASIAHLSEKPDVGKLSAVAMGISNQYEKGLHELPSVVSELDNIVKDPRVQAAHGVISGTILLNNQFTETAMESQLDGAHPVVHIASHFVFKPGDDNQSYLLLAGKDKDAGGYHLTVADFRDNKNLSLRHTDLLTLSACETGMSGDASNGREVDGLGTTAQLKGARSVMSSLWEVNDASTGLLMADFYKRWSDGAGNIAKVEALRQAQLDLLLGKVTPTAAPSRGFNAEPDPNQPAPPPTYAHPYFWAPFVLMGNWR
jgi:CHAT domain-containing protein/Tfp pilus assembly protein PilF